MAIENTLAPARVRPCVITQRSRMASCNLSSPIGAVCNDCVMVCLWERRGDRVLRSVCECDWRFLMSFNEWGEEVGSRRGRSNRGAGEGSA